MRTIIIIPVRLGSWRFPNKPLTMIEGIPMIEHVYRRSLFVSNIDDIVIAACDDNIMKVCEDFGAEVVMTSQDCRTACERVAEAAAMKGYIAHDDIVINVQGDEPVVPPPVIEMTKKRLLENDHHQVANLVEKIINDSDLENEHRVKAVLTAKNNLLFLSRNPIPATVFDKEKISIPLKLTCITAYRGTFLKLYCELERTNIELIEGNDMMRTLEHEIKISSGVSPYNTYPVDIPEDITEVVKILKKDKWFKKYNIRSSSKLDRQK